VLFGRANDSAQVVSEFSAGIECESASRAPVFLQSTRCANSGGAAFFQLEGKVLSGFILYKIFIYNNKLKLLLNNSL
jgi:hypothetical protein